MTLVESTPEALQIAAPPAPDVATLMDPARRLAIVAGEIPSIRSLMRDLGVGFERAKEVQRQLISESPLAPVSEGAPVHDPQAQVKPDAAPLSKPLPRKPSAWPVVLLALPAFVAVWSGWVGLGELTGFGVVHPLPGIADRFSLNTAITLPIGFEAYAVYAIRVYLSPAVSARARAFARRSTVAALVLGAFGQITYHLMAARHMSAAPWQITTAVACLPVAVVFLGSALAHLVHNDQVSTGVVPAAE